MSKINKSITVDEANWEYITRLAKVNKRSASGMIDWLISRSKEEDDGLEVEAASIQIARRLSESEEI